MKFSGFALASGRRAFITMAVMAGLAVASVAAAQAGQPAAPAQGAPAAPAVDPFRFSEAGSIIFVIKGPNAADFEAVWKTIREKLAASDKPELKELGASLKYYKWDVQTTDGNVTYQFIADPASKTTSYELSPFLLFNSGLFPERAEGQAIFDKIVAGLVSLNPISLVKVP